MSTTEAAVRLMRGLPPGDRDLIEDLSVGLPGLADFWQAHYLNSFIKQGGSKLKFVTGGPGSGKSHCLELIANRAARAGYVTVSFSARDVGLYDFKEFYTAILRRCDISQIFARCTRTAIAEMGFSPDDVPDGLSFADYLASERLMDPLTLRELRRIISAMYLNNPWMDNNFALCCALLTGSALGYPALEEHNKALIHQWLRGETVKLPLLRKLGLSPMKISKYNARHMLRSLAELIRIAGFSGLFIAIDDMDAVLSKNSLQEVRYTKNRREDAYESIRELIDEIETLRSVMIFFGFDRILIEDDTAGLKSYNALWMRLQNEIRSERFNKFADIADLDEYALQEYRPEDLCEMSARLARLLDTASAQPITRETASTLLNSARFSHSSLPRQISRLTRGFTTEEGGGQDDGL